MTTLTSPKPALSRPQSKLPISSTITLAGWSIRETWRLLMVAALGMIVAVVLICTVPLFSTVSLTAGLRSVLTATPQDSEVSLSVGAVALDQHIFSQQISSPLQQFMRQRLGSYIDTSPELILQTQGIDIVAASHNANTKSDQMTLLGYDISQAAAHATILQGQFPQAQSAQLEVAITQKTADALHAAVGSSIPLKFTYQNAALQSFTQTLALHVVGIFSPTSADPYWQNASFDPSSQGPFTSYAALMSTNTFLATLSQMGGGNGVFFSGNQEPLLNWYYNLDVKRITFTDLDNLIARLSAAQTEIANNYSNYNQVSVFNQTQLSGPALELYGAPSTIERYRDRSSVATIPADLLAVQIGALVLFFISMIADLLVERQAGVIALLRSRGASRRQIFGSFLTQSIGIGLVALVIGPLLAIPTTRLLGQRMLASANQGALNVLTGNPIQVALTVDWFALAAAVCAVITMILALRGSVSQDVLALRREAARSTRRPLWRRLNLDIIFIIIAVTGFILSLYVSTSSALDPQTNLLISTPLTLVAPLLLVLAGVLLFLRCFPLLLRLGASLASRRPAAPPMVAIAQMARSPRHATRMILLLALASSFAVFTLIFTATQSQQIFNLTAHEVGADFSGTIAQNASLPPSLAQQTAAYRHIPGVLSASLGYNTQATPLGGAQNLTVEIRAVDTSTYAQTAIWTSQDASQPLPALMQELSQRGALHPTPVPAIVDALTWNALDLSKGATFALAPSSLSQGITFLALDEVQHIPTINDSLASGGTSDYTPPGGILVDYQTFAFVLQQTAKTATQPNQVWLRTASDAASLSSVRAALKAGPLALTSVEDRRAMMAQAQSDPLYTNLVGILALGAATAMFLALVGNLLASWLVAKGRLTSFALLRALGCTPGQIASVLLYEQSIIYSAAIGLGFLFGGLLAATVVPALVFSSTPQARNIGSGEFYVIQRVLPIQIIWPLSLLIAFILLVLFCIAALSMMARIVSRPSISQALRLNED
ncbi:MAG TPA: FtsX-like permease family protein [Ktedonobacterales bacterium]|nr:FtsX-like permease family protein [Ktedonobacterales bacterium]